MATRTAEPAVPKPAKALKKKTKPEEAGQEPVAVKVEPASPAQAAGSKAAVEPKPEKGLPPPAKKAWNDMHYQMQQLEKKGKRSHAAMERLQRQRCQEELLLPCVFARSGGLGERGP